MGNLNVTQLRGLARIAEAHHLEEIRATQDQNMFLPSVPEAKIDVCVPQLAELGLGEPRAGDDVVACPGTSTCRLGITSSTILGPKLNGGQNDLKIRVSGCHNGCAQPEAGDIGIYGEGKRMHGKLVPHYQTYFGGNAMAGGALAIKGPSIPSARIETAVERSEVELCIKPESGRNILFLDTAGGQGPYLTALLADLVEVKPEELESVLRDHGKDADFKVLQLGGGECAGVSQVKIGSSFFEAAHERNYRDALKFQRKFEDSVKCAEEIARLIGQGVSELLGGQKHEDLQCRRKSCAGYCLPSRAWSRQLAKFAEDYASPAVELNDARLTEWFTELDAWTVEAAEFCLGFDRQLDLAGALPLSSPPQPNRCCNRAPSSASA